MLLLSLYSQRKKSKDNPFQRLFRRSLWSIYSILSNNMAPIYSGADLTHTLALIAPKSRPLLVQVEFEVFGDIHGINFTKYAKEMSKKLGVNGWIRFNNKRGSVVGQLEGEKDKIDQMALWLKLQGAPGSRISHCDFRSWQIVDTQSFRDFRIRF